MCMCGDSECPSCGVAQGTKAAPRKGQAKRVYVVYRHGSNAANQSGLQKMVVGAIEASNADSACYLMQDRATCFNNQYLSAKAWNSASRADCLSASLVEIYRNRTTFSADCQTAFEANAIPVCSVGESE